MAEKYEKISEVENSAQSCDNIINTLVDSCCKDLDNYINSIRDNYRDISKVDNLTLDNIILNLPMLIYYASSRMEYLGFRDDLSTINKKRKLVEVLEQLDIKTQTLRSLTAEVKSDESQIISSMYSHAYKCVKAKLDVAYEILASCKKIMSRRIEEYKVEHSDTGRLLNTK